jgi:hypothetical protein
MNNESKECFGSAMMTFAAGVPGDVYCLLAAGLLLLFWGCSS